MELTTIKADVVGATNFEYLVALVPDVGIEHECEELSTWVVLEEGASEHACVGKVVRRDDRASVHGGTVPLFI